MARPKPATFEKVKTVAENRRARYEYFLEEFFEAWTAGYLNMHDKPLVMLDPHGHYDGLLAWLHTLVDTGYVQRAALDRLIVVKDVDEAMAACAPRDIAH